MNADTVATAAARRGFVLVIVMIVIVMISLAGLSYVWTLSTENKATHLHGDALQLEQTLTSGQEYVKAVCARTWEQRNEQGGVLDNETLFRQIALDCDTQRRRQARFSVVSPQSSELGAAGYRYGLQDESSKLNLSVLPQWDEAEYGAAERALNSLPGMTEAVAAAILDWIDSDTTPRPSGAEAEYYAGQGLPYAPRDGVPFSLEELLLVRDVSRHQLFGADTNRNYQVDAHELQVAATAPTGGSGPPWAGMLTVHSAERNVACDGQERININQDDLKGLYNQLSEVFDAPWAKFIIAYRQFGPLEYGDTAPVESGRVIPRKRGEAGSSRTRLSKRDESADFKLDLSKPAKFPIESIYDLIDVHIQLPPPDTSAQRSKTGRGSASRRRPTGPGPGDLDFEEDAQRVEGPVLASPFENESTAMGQYLPQLLDRLSVDDAETVRGRVNIQRGSREVIAAVPGIDSDVVDQILTARVAHESDDIAAVRHAVWLLTDQIVELAEMRRLSSYLTGGGDVFRGQIVAVLDDSRQSARAELVIDATVSPPRQLYWKRLEMLGAGFSADVAGAVTGDRETTIGPAP